MADRGKPVTVVVGTGRLARALLPRLARSGYRIAAVVTRRRPVARRGLGGTRATTALARAVGQARLLLLAVPDRAIDPLAARLARLRSVDWRGRVVLHHSGALGPEALAALARRGAATGVLHPLQTLGGGPGAGRALGGSRARIEGGRAARAAARRVAHDLGLIPLRFRRELGCSERVAYHAAAALVANDLVALTSLALELLESAGLERRAGLRALLPLMRGTLAQLERGGLTAALSGPAVRGDDRTLEEHLRRLAELSAEDAELHRLLSRRLARTAAANGALDARALGRLLRVAGPRARRGL